MLSYRKVMLMDKKSAPKNSCGEVDLLAAVHGSKTNIAHADVVAVLGRGGRIQILKSRVGYKGQRVTPTKFLRMLIDQSV